jgi:predicted nuclease of predicted toxin-antitoxin system
VANGRKGQLAALTLKFFIDECLTAALVAIAKERELFAVFGPHAGKAGWQDWTIAKYAYENDLIVVTNNRRDFLKEYSKFELHPGLVIIIPRGNRQDQIEWFTTVLDALDEMAEAPVNKLVEVDREGKVSIRNWHLYKADLD